MGYTLQGIVGKEAAFVACRIEGVRVVQLTQGYALLPLTEALRERHSIPFLEFGHSDAALHSINAFFGTLTRGRFAYVEAEFFGGMGGQASAIWEDGTLIFGPFLDAHAINQALLMLGVVRTGSVDEFAALDLGRCRDTEDWIKT